MTETATDGITRLSEAVDEIYRLRALLADEAGIIEAHLALKGFPQSRRTIAMNQVLRMRAAARGTPEYRQGFSAKEALRSAGADECLTNTQWLEQHGLVEPVEVPCDAPKPFVDFSGETYGPHEIARNLGGTCEHCGTTFKFWGRA